MKKMADLICKHKIFIVIVAILLLIPAAIGMYKTKVNYNILVYLPDDIETLKGQNILTSDFNMGAFSVTVVDKMPAKDILKLEDKIKNVKGVDKVIGINDITGTTIPLDFLPEDVVNKVSKKDSSLLLITFKESTSDDSTLEAVDEIRSITEDKAQVGGMSAMVLDTQELFNSEMALYVAIAVVLCIIVLMIFLDSYIVPFLLLANIGVAILFNMGTNIFLGDISYITKAISSVLQLGVTTDFSIFLYHKYEAAKKKYKDKSSAMSHAIVDTLTSVFGSSLTTIAGFLALCTMKLTLGMDIGIVMAKGVLFGLLCVITLFPALLLVFDKYIDKTTHKVITPKFTLIKKFVLNHYIIVFIVFIILLVPFYIFQTKTNVYYKLDESIPDNYGFKKATKKLKEDYGIVSQTMILASSDIENYKLNNMVDDIEKLDGVDMVLSPSKLSKLGISEDILSSDIKRIYQSKDYKLILVNSSYDIATTKLNNQIEKINKIVDKYDKKAIVAGEGPLMRDLVSITDQDFHNVNYTSIAVIFILMLIVTKSISLPVLLVTAIEFAIFVNMGIPYLMGSKIPFIASVVIGTIQLGATIDYAILMTTKYLEERKKGNSRKNSVSVALDNSVSSIFVSGMCFFAATIGVGIVSKIDMIGTLCTLISRGAIISMIVVICVLPSILLIFDRLIIKTSLGFKGGKNMKKKLAIIIFSLILINPYFVKALSKEESVYTKMSSSGKVKSVLVVEHLINDDKLDEINDITSLTDIKNLNGSESFSLNGKNINWKANGNDIYYQGKTSDDLPISLNVSYKLDGNLVKAKDIKNKKGHVEITINYKNNLKHEINGNTLYTPFVVISELNLDGKYNKNIKVSNGKIINNGTTNMVVAIASPGINESLNIDDINLSEVKIEYDTTKFNKEAIYVVATSKVLDNNDLSKFGNISSIKEDINSLSSAADMLVNGANELNNGVDKLKNGAVELNNGINTVFDGTNKIKNAIDESVINLENDNSEALDADTINMIKNQAVTSAELSSDVLDQIGKQAIEGLKNDESYNQMNEIVTTVDSNEQLLYMCTNQETIVDEYKQICSLYNTYKPVVTALEKTAYNVAVSTASNIAKSVASNVSESVATSVANSVKSKASEKTIKSLNELSKNIGLLSDGMSKLSDGSLQLVNGIDTLKIGTNKMYNGTKTFNDTGIKKLSSFVNTNLVSKVDTVNSLIKLSNEYQSYSGKDDSISGTTKFIMVIK